VGRVRHEFEGTDRFVIKRRIGAGAFGVVYEAYDRERRLTVALKTLRHASADALYRFKWEFRALADLAHPNLVALYELLVQGERCFFTMELVRGVSFVDYVRGPSVIESPATADAFSLASPSTSPVPDAPTEESDKGTHAGGPYKRPRERSDGDLPFLSPPEGPSVDRLRDALAQLTHGLCALHGAGKLHRDIKPSNVLVTTEGRVVLLDFGLVTEFGLRGRDAPTDARVVGTPTYMSPEQAAGQSVSEGTDWYSIGVMLYEALTGRVPFSGDFVQMLNQKHQQEPPAPSDAVRGIPEDLNSLCRDLLWSDPRARVGGRDVLARIGRTTADGGNPQVRATVAIHGQPFVGRQSHLAALRGAFADTKVGRAVTVYVHGESGMGKSALVRRFFEELARDEPDAVLLTGRCYEQESVPYKALDQLVDGLSQHLHRLPPAQAEALLPRDVVALSRLFPVLRRVEALTGARRRVLEIPAPQELRRRAIVALRDLLSRLAGQSPLVLFIDDLQWGDVDSASVLAELVRPPDPPALLLVGCYRSDEATTSPLLRVLLGLRGTGEWGADVRDVVVGELEPAEARALVQALVDAPHRHLALEADVIGRESGGNPFFIDEIVRYFQTSAGRSDVRTIGLDAVVRARLSPLSAPAARLLNVVALAGRPVSFDIAKQAADLNPEDYSVLGALRVGRLIRTRARQAEEELEAYHDRIREAVVSQLSATAQSALHERLAEAMDMAGRGDPETLAMHFQRGGNSERAAHYAIEAATQASEALAFDRAARLYRMALELRPREQADDRDVRSKLAAALANAGRGGEAAQQYFHAAAGAPHADFVELQRRAAEQLLFSGHIDEGLRALRTALETIGMRLAATPRRALLSWLARRVYIRLRGLGFRERDARDVSSEELLRIDSCWSVAVGLAYVETFRAADFQARHLLLALKAGEPYRVARALAMEGGYSSTGGWRSAARTARIFAATMALAERIGHPHALGLATISAGVAASLEGRWTQALELCERADVILRERCTGVAWELDTVDLTSLVSLIYLGRLSDVAQRLPALLKDAHERGDLYKSTFLRTRISYASHLAADEPAGAREEVRKGIEGWSHEGFQLEHYWTLLSEADIAMYEGGTLARRLFRTQWPALARSLLLRVQYSLIEALDRRARSALSAAADVAAADRAALLREAERDARRIERERTPWGNALALLVRAGVAVARGDVDAALTLLTSAEPALLALDMALHAASARRHRGQLLGGEEGHGLVMEADRWMAGQRIRNPARMAVLLCPGVRR
jgi:serine/threonine protein kinase